MISKTISRYFFYILFTIFLVEIILRLLGYKPANIKQREYYIQYFKEHPSIFIYDSILGFTNKPGKFTIPIFNDTTLITYTINSSNERIVSLDKNIFKDEVLLFGCSYTFGANLLDTSYAAAFLQNKLISNKIKVKNKAGDAYGTTQFYLQIKNIDNSDNHIKALILNYASFHNERAIMARNFQSGLFTAMQKKILVPYAKLVNDSLQIEYKNLQYKLFPLQGKLALVEYISNLYNKYERRNEKKIARLLLEKIINICKEKNIILILIAMENDKETHEIVNSFKQDGVYTTSYNIDLNSPEYNFLPYDIHPNRKANIIFADTIFNKLKELKVIH